MNKAKTNKHLHVLLAVIFILFLFTYSTPAYEGEEIEADGCTSILVGKLASVNGATMTSHSCDSSSDRTWIAVVPHKKHKPGAICKIYTKTKRAKGPGDKDVLQAGEIPQVPETYAYINTAYAVMNEHQLAIGETTIGQNKKLRTSRGMIDCPELYRLILERAKTAREAISVADELTKKYGYIDTGECLTFADPNEVWHFEIFGPGLGRLGAIWAAVRIPDGHVGVSANASRIRQIDLDDPDHYLASENIKGVAAELGLWDPESGKPFEVCYAFAHRQRFSSRRREWMVLNSIAPALKLHPNDENYPLSVKPERKLSLKDILSLFRNHFQDTPFDFTQNLTAKNRKGEIEVSPVACPFLNRELQILLKIKSERSIACQRATYVQITQSRAWLPDPIGGVVWLGYDNPETTPHTPFYCGISKMPASYEIDGRREFSRNCAWWAFRRVSQLAKFRWQVMVKDIETVWREIEDKAISNQENFEKKALKLYKKDPNKAQKLLTGYCIDMAEQAVRRYWKLGDELWAKYNNYF
jgi:dipeptidase